MKKLVIVFSLSIIFGVCFASDLKPISYDEYLKNFDLDERSSMKIRTADMLDLIEKGEAILLDIRFAKEFEAWNMPFAKNIPLNELPNRLDELPKDKLIITACPHNDRSNMARIYLMLKGYNAKYLSDGLLRVADFLRGDNAVEFMEEMSKIK
ncbi:rhodanese-like domain-containing protein [Arcobacter sp. FWKO B]|uniref:rhodanese-like domain-containing protein n=1 Tax=Arcobacter sp. FWKO B TaxID=2593672 RepID=UPI0018A52C2B|nr:rhodanese-like domain-containing protein [Arcobacter sp. FWKO B]QOG12764.1 rhodanese-like domain-containing protein [Arcobacter sp. FWKO B]